MKFFSNLQEAEQYAERNGLEIIFDGEGNKYGVGTSEEIDKFADPNNNQDFIDWFYGDTRFGVVQAKFEGDENGNIQYSKVESNLGFKQLRLF